jgi:RNA polymerase sigma factor FliA
VQPIGLAESVTELAKPVAAIDDEPALWQAWREAADAGARTRLIERHIEFARIIAARLYSRRFSDDIEFDDYLQLARVALIECVDRYDPTREATFRTYASHRVHGAILSGLEAMTDRACQIALKRRTERERSASLTIPGSGTQSDTFAKLASLAVGLAIGFMLDDIASYREESGAYADNAYTALALRQMHRRLRQLVDQLPEREAHIIRSHYFGEVPFERIAAEMRLTKGRISQLHKRAIELLHLGLRAESLDIST